MKKPKDNLLGLFCCACGMPDVIGGWRKNCPALGLMNARRGAWRLERQAVHRRRRVGEWRTVRAVGPAWNGAGISGGTGPPREKGPRFPWQDALYHRPRAARLPVRRTASARLPVRRTASARRIEACRAKPDAASATCLAAGLRRPVPRPFRPAWPGGGRTGRSAGHLPMRRSR
ncbi:MAG: hypothetical protein ACLSAH_14440 [Bilophila wadsworthia]